MVGAEGWFRRYRRAVGACRRASAEADALRAELELVSQERDSLRARLRQVEARGAPLVAPVRLLCSHALCQADATHGPHDLAVVCGVHAERWGWPAVIR